MHDDGLQARIAGQHLPAIAGGGVAFDDAVDVFAQVVEHRMEADDRWNAHGSAFARRC